MKFVKKILFILVLLIVLATCGIFSLTKTVTPAAIKEILNKQLVTFSTQKSHIAGDVSWHLFPRPGIKVTGIYIGETENKTNDSVFIENLLFNLQITPLLSGQLVFNELRIDGIKINIHPEAQPDALLNKTSITTATLQNNDSNKIPAQFALHSVLLTRGEIVITRPQNKIILSNLQIGAKQLHLKNNFFSLQLKTNLITSIANNKAKATLNYKGHMNITPSSLTHPLDALIQAPMDGQLVIHNLRFNQLKIAKISANLRKKQNEFSLNPFNVSLYSGKSVGDINYEFSSKKLTINQTATDLDANQLFKDLFAKNIAKGTLDFSIHASTKLLDNTWKNNLHGNGNLTIKNGVLYFVDFKKFTDEAIDKLHALLNQERLNVKLAIPQSLSNLKRQQQLTPTTELQPGNTKFQLFSIRYHVLDNKLFSDNLILQTYQLQLKGNGEVNLKDASQDFNLSAKLTSSDQEIGKIQQQLGGSFPLKVCGTLTKPQIIPNIQELGPVISSYLLKNTLERPVKQIKHHLENLLTTTENLLQ